MDELQKELQELQNLESQGALDDTQKARLAGLPGLIAEAEKTASEKIKTDLASALAQKEHFRTKFEKEEAERKALEEKLKGNTGNKSLDVEDYIDISASLEGLDQREKEKLAREHKLTGKPLSELRKDEDFLLWQSAKRQKEEKERLTLKPNGTQSDSERPKSLTERLATASLADKEKILKEAGLYKENRPRADRTYIGNQR